jgi:hypothetical protein
VIEVEGITQQTFEEVGAEFDVRRPAPPILYRVGGKDVDVTGGGWGFLLSMLTRQGAKLAGASRRRPPKTACRRSSYRHRTGWRSTPETSLSMASSATCADRSPLTSH